MFSWKTFVRRSYFESLNNTESGENIGNTHLTKQQRLIQSSTKHPHITLPGDGEKSVLAVRRPTKPCYEEFYLHLRRHINNFIINTIPVERSLPHHELHSNRMRDKTVSWVSYKRREKGRHNRLKRRGGEINDVLEKRVSVRYNNNNGKWQVLDQTQLWGIFLCHMYQYSSHVNQQNDE